MTFLPILFIHLCWIGDSKNKFISEVDICKDLTIDITNT